MGPARWELSPGHVYAPSHNYTPGHVYTINQRLSSTAPAPTPATPSTSTAPQPPARLLPMRCWEYSSPTPEQGGRCIKIRIYGHDEHTRLCVRTCVCLQTS